MFELFTTMLVCLLIVAIPLLLMRIAVKLWLYFAEIRARRELRTLPNSERVRAQRRL